MTFHESGFSYDDYPIELAWTLRTTSTAGGAVSRTSGTDKRPRYVKRFLIIFEGRGFNTLIPTISV